MTRDLVAVRMNGKPTVIARRLDHLEDHLFAETFDVNPRYQPCEFRTPVAATTRRLQAY
ncbi:MAG: hypothetical protein ABSG76_02180 [Xanthobacteraceae bacterium]